VVPNLEEAAFPKWLVRINEILKKLFGGSRL
jgi:hypothetical protein